MSRPYKTTGCFRFFLFIIILAPLAYLGASYYHGQDGIQNLKNLFSKGIAVFNGSSAKAVDKKPADEAVPVPASSPVELEKEYQISLDLKEKQIEALIKENLELKQKISELENKQSQKAPQ
jgi:hypothetical protein